MRAGSVGRIGTYSNHEFIVTQNGGDVLKIDTSKISNFTGRVGAAMGASTGAQFPLDVNGVSMLRTEADMWQSEQKFMRIGRYCLLYTSPSPRDVEESRMPSSA